MSPPAAGRAGGDPSRQARDAHRRHSVAARRRRLRLRACRRRYARPPGASAPSTTDSRISMSAARSIIGPSASRSAMRKAVLDAAVAAYEARLAPPPDILSRTFGFIYERRTAIRPDSIAYVYDTFRIGPITMCRAWKIVEHPNQTVHEVGPVAGSAGIGGGVATNANSSVVRHDNGGDAEVQTVVFPCTERTYTAVRRGSLTAPLPRHPDAPPSAAPPASLAPAAPASPASLAPAAPAPPASLGQAAPAPPASPAPAAPASPASLAPAAPAPPASLAPAAPVPRPSLAP